MNAIKSVAIVLIIAGTLALVYGGFSYSSETHQATLGPLDLSVKDQKTVNVPIWAGVAMILAGSVFLLGISKKNKKSDS